MANPFTVVSTPSIAPANSAPAPAQFTVVSTPKTKRTSAHAPEEDKSWQKDNPYFTPIADTYAGPKESFDTKPISSTQVGDSIVTDTQAKKFFTSYTKPIESFGKQVAKPVDALIDWSLGREFDPANEVSTSDMWTIGGSVVDMAMNVIPATALFHAAGTTDVGEKVLSTLPAQAAIGAGFGYKVGGAKGAAVGALVGAIPTGVQYIFDNVKGAKTYYDSLSDDGKKGLITTLSGLGMIAGGWGGSKFAGKPREKIVEDAKKLPIDIQKGVVESIKKSTEGRAVKIRPVSERVVTKSPRPFTIVQQPKISLKEMTAKRQASISETTPTIRTASVQPVPATKGRQVTIRPVSERIITPTISKQETAAPIKRISLQEIEKAKPKVDQVEFTKFFEKEYGDKTFDVNAPRLNENIVKEWEANKQYETPERVSEYYTGGEFTDPKRVAFYEKEISEGRQLPIVVWEKYPFDGTNSRMVADGNHKLKAYLNLGVKEIPVVKMDDIYTKFKNSMQDLEFSTPNKARDTTNAILSRETVQDPVFDLKPFQSRTLNRLINLDQFLNAIKIKVGDKEISLNNHIQSIRNLGKSVANAILRSTGLEKKISEVIGDKNIAKAVKNIGDDAFIGATTPEGLVINSSTAKTIRQTYEEIGSLDYSKSFTGIKNEALNNLAKLGFTWKINRNRPEIIQKYIPENLVKFFEYLDSAKAELYASFGQDLQNRGLVQYLAENYDRYVLDNKSRKRMMKDLGKGGKPLDEFAVTMADGSVRTFGSFLEMETFLKNAERLGINAKRIMPDVEAMSSLNKQKASGAIDLYRTHSDVVQLMDYIREYGEIIRNDQVVKAFEGLSKTDNPKVKGYIKNFFSGKFAGMEGVFQNPVEQALNIRFGSKGLRKGMEALTNNAVVSLLSYGIDTLAQAATFGIPRAALLNKLKVYTNVTPKVEGFMRENGFTQAFEGSAVRKFLGEENVATFSGVGVENVAKTQAALGNMRSFLESKGVKVSKNADEIVSKFEEMRDEPISKLDKALKDGTITQEQYNSSVSKLRGEYLKWKDELFDDLNMISNVSSMARTSVNFLSRFGFGALKSFNLGQTGSMLRDATALVDGAIKRSGKDIKGPAKRLAIAVGLWFTVYNSIKLIMDKNEEGNEEAHKAIASHIASQSVGDPLANIKSTFSGFLSNPVTVPLSLMADVADIIALIASNPDNKAIAAKVGINEFINDVLQKTQPGQLADKGTKLATGKSLREYISSGLGVMNREGTTRRVQSTGFKIGSRAEAAASILGYGTDSAIQNMIYNAISKADLKQGNQLSDAEAIVAQFFLGMIQEPIRNITAIKDSLDVTSYNKELMEANFVSAAAKAAEGSESLIEYMDRLGIPEELMADIVDAKASDIKSMAKSSNSIEKLLGDFFWQSRIEGDTFSEKLKNLEEKNPKAYNNFVTGMGLASKYFSERDPSLPITDKTTDEVVAFFGDSKPHTDAAIAEANGTSPLSTSVSSVMKAALFDFADNIGKEGVDEAKRKFGEIENMLKIVMNNSSYTDGVINAVANISNDMYAGMQSMSDAGYKGFAKDFPVTAEVLRRGLELRGEKVSDDSTATPQSTQTELPTTNTAGSQKQTLSSILNTQLLGAPAQKKPITIKAPKTEKTRPLFSNMSPKTQGGQSLAEILRGLHKR